MHTVSDYYLSNMKAKLMWNGATLVAHIFTLLNEWVGDGALYIILPITFCPFPALVIITLLMQIYLCLKYIQLKLNIFLKNERENLRKVKRFLCFNYISQLTAFQLWKKECQYIMLLLK